jgi:uncharacterized OB-fold protein
MKKQEARESVRATGINLFRCPKCGASTQGRYAFCPECGEPLEMECPYYGTRWRFYVHYTYCPACGKKLSEKIGIKRPQGWV